MKKYVFFISSILLLPSVSFAAPRSYSELVNQLVGILDVVVIVLTTAAFATFMYKLGMTLYGVTSKDKDGGKTGVKRLNAVLKYGILGLFIMVSVWGILRVARNTLFTDSANPSGLGTQEQDLCANFAECE